MTCRTIELMRQFRLKGIYGDPTRPELLPCRGLENCESFGGLALDDARLHCVFVRHCDGAKTQRPALSSAARQWTGFAAYELL